MSIDVKLGMCAIIQSQAARETLPLLLCAKEVHGVKKPGYSTFAAHPVRNGGGHV